MQSLYLATTLAAALACLLTSILLFARRKSGERSRTILAVIVSFSVGNYITRFIDLSKGVDPEQVISGPLLLLALFMVTSYIMYPIEVISPGYLNKRRIIKIYTPWLILVGIYALSLKFGVDYPAYNTLFEIIPQIGHFHGWFRLLLALLIFAPFALIFLIPYTRRYNNTNIVWITKYTICLSINTIAYIIVLLNESIEYKTAYYYISAGCSMYIAYMELFERLIGSNREPQITNPAHNDKNNLPKDGNISNSPNNIGEKLIIYMDNTSCYRDPDISLNSLAGALCTNRTTLSNTIHNLGHINFNTYINSLRIEEFIKLIKSRANPNYQDAFYEVGFRSRTTALRNFKQYTGKTPSEYFNQ